MSELAGDTNIDSVLRLTWVCQTAISLGGYVGPGLYRLHGERRRRRVNGDTLLIATLARTRTSFRQAAGATQTKAAGASKAPAASLV